MKTRSFPPKRSAGIGLIEVLIATVVVAVGLMAVASLQGDLINGSRTNKTRAEAKVLADTKIEQLRDTIQRAGVAGYDGLASSAANESITGVNETFARGWTVTNLTNPARKQISVTVSWTGDQVIEQSIIAFDAVGNSALLAIGASTAGTPISGPSTNAESSDEITETIKVPRTTPGSVVTVNGKTYIVQDTGTIAIGADTCSGLGLTEFENGLMTRRVDHDGVTGNEAIELYEQVTISNVNYCIPRLRYNGGVIIPIRGIVHSGATVANNDPTLLDVNLFTFNASETGAFCVFKPQFNAKSAPYVCYVGGNCQGFAGTTSTDVTQCPGSISALKVGPGGWRGKVGLLGVASRGKNVCFSEELAAAPATLDTARNYYTRRGGLNEGINKPYSCHDFLIIDGKNTEAQVHNECVTQSNAIGGFNLASKTIQRDITSGNNVFDPTVDTSFCVGSAGTDYVITGNITGASASPTVMVDDGATTTPCSVTGTSTYTCSINTSANSVTISGVYSSQPVSCNVSLSSATPSTTGCPLAFTTLPVYTITGHISASTAAAANAVSLVVVDGSNTINCTNNQNYTSGYNTYTCSISTLSTTGLIIDAQAATGYAVTPATYNVPTLSGTTSTVVVPSTANDFVSSVVPSLTIKGTITIGANGPNNGVGLAVTDAVLSGNCGTNANGDGIGVPPGGAWLQNKSASYQCTFYENSTNSFSLAVSPTSWKSGNSSGNFIPTAAQTCGTTVVATSSTGQLNINLNNITTNQCYDITIN